ncbi:multidrug effflux MFS transporter [Reyranella sp.]|jgi:DHA1 family bicyclomycin/chloramphenicol resistance-like MFS transporter|uniref:multidrug effflux MFS transporter n=1 Tax=Reyranella sp. TaxID=1929291 RepID=UPI000BD58AE4|nr:multidrug effflux MFS transporter [Reyranella sp.]OYY44896.1 MAG: hypothetical protein B7Y57_07195 [Rhodospirillales bacterium 35-66-84]OYZ95265.1 MAG: hypothetical protein B7Y08_08045 [Rhodospirillales bacterium 24-66-33]OZB26959.1 MAG: hypothetical protein B7X63_07545 [Rhodospirillales bacterium 39-66-50]HQT11747.1 multidrug effflux MFS transporter [Reyranella sp.]
MTAQAAPRPRGIVIAAIACSGTMAMHIFVPALPAVALDLRTTASAAQLTLTVYLVGIAGGQLVYGPLSDRFGRRPVLLFSLALFLVSSLVGALAPAIDWLIAARVLQALGACGGLVLGRAMARDGASPEQAARQLALLVMVMTVSPAIAPLLGGLVSEAVGWRGIFVLLSVAAAVLLVLTVVAVPETNYHRSPLPGVHALLAVYGQLAARADFRGYAIGGACMSTSLYAFLSASPFLFMDLLHRPAGEIGFYYMGVVAGITAGSWLASRLTRSVGIKGLLRLGASLGMAGAAGLLVLHLTHALSVPTLLATMLLFALGAGITSPTATASTLSVDPQRIGATSGLYGCMQMGYGALCTLLVGLWHDGTALPVALILLASATISQVSFFIVRKSAF